MKGLKVLILLSFVLVLTSCKEFHKVKEVKQEITDNVDIAVNELVGELDIDTVSIEMRYFGWACPCAQWVTRENEVIFEEKRKNGEHYGDSLFYHVEAANDSIFLPIDSISDSPYYRFTGSFYKEMQLMHVEGEMGPAITFRYNKVELIK